MTQLWTINQNINDAFEGKFLECKSEKNKKSSMNKYL